MNLLDLTDEALAAQVVVYRAFGLHHDTAKHCMSELLRRQQAGSVFDFEIYIEEQRKLLPQTESKTNVLESSLKLIASLK